MNRRETVLGLLAFGVSPGVSLAQQPGKVARIGFLGSASAVGYAGMIDSLKLGFREIGYVEGKTLAIEFRWADDQYDRLPALADDLVRQDISVLVTHGTPAIRAAKQATRSIPIVMVSSSDAVASGLVSTLSQPGGNITGLTLLNPEINAKRIELLYEAAPRIRRIAVLLNSNNPSNAPIFRAMEKTAQSLKLAIKAFEVQRLDELENTLLNITKATDGVTVTQDAMFFENAKIVAQLVTKMKIPSAGFKEFAEAGGLIGYGPNYLELYRRAAHFVGKILNGEKPGDIPVEQPTKFELVVNMKTARSLGVNVPQSVLVRADEVIR